MGQHFFVKGALGLTIIALPFDNVFFHLGTLLSWIGAFLIVREAGVQSFVNSIGANKGINWSFLSIVLIMAFSNFVNSQNIEAWRTMAVFVARYWMFFILLTYLLFEKILDLRFLLWAAILCLFVQFTPFFLQMINGGIFIERFQGFTSNPNVLGLYAGFGMILSVYLMSSQRGNRVSLVVFILLAFMSTVSMLASGNRGGWVAVAVALVIYSVGQFPLQPKRLFTSLIGVFGLCAGILSQMSGPRARLADLIAGDSTHRIDVWLNSWSLFIQQPILGYGLDTKAALLENHFIYSEHNIILNVMLAMGLIGLLAYGALVFFVCWPAVKNKNTIGLSLMGFLMGAGMFGFDFYRSQHFMICFAVLAVVCIHHRRPTGALFKE